MYEKLKVWLFRVAFFEFVAKFEISQVSMGNRKGVGNNEAQQILLEI